LLKKRVRVSEAASSSQVKGILAVFVIGVEDAPLGSFEVRFNADLRKLFDDDLSDLTVFWISSSGAVVIDLKAVEEAGLSKKLFRLLRIVRISSRVGIVAEYLRTEQPLNG
jgi:hypothetical protein